MANIKNITTQDLYITISTDGHSHYTCEGTDHSEVIQAAINYASLTGQTLFFKNGNYYFNGVKPKKLKILGENKENVVFHLNANNELFDSSDKVEGFLIENISLYNDTYDQEAFNLSHVDCTNNQFKNIYAEKWAGRIFSLNGDWHLENCFSPDCRRGFGAFKLSNDTRKPIYTVSNCRFDNINYRVGSEIEGGEINTHGDGYFMAYNLYLKGFSEQQLEINCRRWFISNISLVMPDDVAGAEGLTWGLDGSGGLTDWSKGSGSNINIENISNTVANKAMRGLVANGVSFHGVNISGNGTSNGVGVHVDGGSSAAISFHGLTIDNVADPLINDAGSTTVLIAHKFINCGDTNTHSATTYS